MPQLLKLHPDSRCCAVRHIEVETARPRSDSLVLSYVVTGTMSDILMPPAAAATRADRLWQHTCFEAFVRTSPDAEYCEFNFAPSTQWAAYQFGGYRSGRRVADEIETPRIEVQSERGSCTLRASLNLGGLPALAGNASWHIGLSAVIEDLSGGLSYWALAHPPGKPDFHHADCFALEFSPAVPS
jgi:hypothetical protein